MPSLASHTAGVGGWLQGADGTGAELKMTHILEGDLFMGYNPLSEVKWKTQKPSVIWLARVIKAFVIIL